MKYLLFLFLSFFLFSCADTKNKPDVSGIAVDLRLERFEPSFFRIDTNDIGGGLVHLRNGFPHFYPQFMQNILQVNPMDPESAAIIKQVLSTYKGLYDSLADKYKNLDWLQEELTTGFRYVKYHFPQYNVPKVITYIGTLDAPGVVLTNEYLGIGLHQFGGKNFSAYQVPEVQQLYPAYISRRFDREYMVASSMKAIADDAYPDQSVGRPLVEQMIEKGKQWYLLDKFLPDAPDSVKTGFTKRQLSWAEENEGNIWAYIVKNENLYSVEPPVIQTYIGEAPSTQGMSDSSPGNIGQWVGWRIVEQFAGKNENLNVQQVLQTPARAILEGAKYRPK